MGEAIFDDRVLERTEQDLQKKLRQTKKMRRAERKRRAKLPKTFIELSPIRYAVSEDCIALKKGVTDYVQVNGVKVDDLTPSDKQLAIDQFHFFLKTFDEPFKLVFQTFPADTSKPLALLNRQILRNESAVFQPFLAQKRWELEEAARAILHHEFYFQIFAANDKELAKIRTRILGVQAQFFQMKRMTLDKKLKILFKLNNMNTPILHDVPAIPFFPEKAPDKGFDPILLSYIQPRGGFTPCARYIKKGDGYETCVHLIEYKKKARPFWGKGMLNQPNIIAIQDTETISRQKIKEAINDSTREYQQRQVKARNTTELKEAKSEENSLNDLADQMIDSQETVKELHTRLYIYAQTKSDLEDLVKQVLDSLALQDFRGMIQLEEMVEDYHALFTPFSEQRKEVPRSGQEIRARSLAASYAFDFSYFIDDDGMYTGNTETNGAFIFNPTHRDPDRLSHGMMYVGLQRSGKSSALKKHALARVIIGEQVFIFSVSSEFRTLAETLGGIHEDLATKGTNLLQVFATCVNEETLDILVDASFDAHLSKVLLVYRFLMDEKVPALERLLNAELRDFYQDWCKKIGVNFETDICALAHKQYPILSDFYTYLKRRVYQDVAKKTFQSGLSKREQEEYEVLLSNISHIIKNDPLYNQHTHTENIEDCPIVVYNIEMLLKKNRHKLNAQLFNSLNVFWDISIRKGQQEKKKWDRGEIGIEDIRYRTMMFDEFHNWTRYAYPEQLEILDRFWREAPKYFTIPVIASHHFHDLLPKADGSATTDAVREAMNNIFEATPYKFFLRQSPTSVTDIQNAYGDEFSQSEINRLTRLPQGHAILNIQGKQNVAFKFDLSEQELAIFDGGR
ncbi:hypothetical protein EP56_01760 [Listeriaceae bacterium FSL A5-0209]|nr:hypothetical protein EP56_01760 [Listeriaceae bacterium FSL A5-0209]